MPKPTKHIAQFFIKLDGQQLAAEYYDQLISVEVDDSLSLPDMFVITLRDRGMKALHDDVFKPGKKVQISVEPEAPEGPDDTTPAKTVLMTGEITSIEPDLNDIDRATLVVRGYDKSHRLTRIRKTQTFTQVTDSDLASQIAAGAGLSPQVTSTSVVYPYVMQANQTDLEFLIER
ncbi:MAG TPA: hypothetical protein VKY74_11990, partial [Chloroflexia bacterium]|nr:hypothetical protein [Chloroflexia bacterium]